LQTKSFYEISNRGISLVFIVLLAKIKSFFVFVSKIIKKIIKILTRKLKIAEQTKTIRE